MRQQIPPFFISAANLKAFRALAKELRSALGEDYYGSVRPTLAALFRWGLARSAFATFKRSLMAAAISPARTRHRLGGCWMAREEIRAYETLETELEATCPAVVAGLIHMAAMAQGRSRALLIEHARAAYDAAREDLATRRQKAPGYGYGICGACGNEAPLRRDGSAHGAHIRHCSGSARTAA